MNYRYWKFQHITKICVAILMGIAVLLNMYATSTTFLAINIALKSFAGVALANALVLYFKTLKLLSKLEAIKFVQAVIAVLAYICAFVAVWFLGYNSFVFYFFIAIAALLYFVFKINEIDNILPTLCKELDEEVEAFNCGEYDDYNFEDESDIEVTEEDIAEFEKHNCSCHDHDCNCNHH
ncbi:MAG: hypothetical protein R3Y32_03055 [Bacillota bacterium]